MKPAPASAALLALALATSACLGKVPGPQAAHTQPAITDPAEIESAEPTEEPLPSTLGWESCGERFECSTLAVPVDHAEPDGPTVSLALIRLPAPAAAKRIGSLVVNPGGPGGSGVDFVRHGAVEIIPAELRARFDIVGFDPRGVARSEGIDCGDVAIDRFLEARTSGLDEVIRAGEALAAACSEQAGELLGHVDTVSVAADLDLLRQALGDRRLTYLGYSYGTLIGAIYAGRYPDRIRALVLDGAVDPSLDAVGRARDHAAAIDVALDEFLGWCAEEPQCPMTAEGQAPRAVFDQALARLSDGPAPAPFAGEGETVSREEALLVIASLLTDRAHGWPGLAAGLALLSAEDNASGLLGIFEPLRGQSADPDDVEDVEDVYGLDFGQLTAVNCLDWPAPAADHLPALIAELEAESVLFGAQHMMMWAPCSFWPVPPVREAALVTAPDTPPLVVIGTLEDSITPYHWAAALAEQLDHAVLFTRDGDTHTAFGGGNVCTDRAIIGYLLDEQPPEAGLSCG